MRVLAIESSCGSGSVAVCENGRVLAEEEFENPRGRGVEFFAALERVVERCGDFDLVLVGTGPGGYNALRSGIGSALGVARARGVELKGVCSLLGYDSPEYHVVGDARAGQWFFAHVKDGRLEGEVRLMAPEAALAAVRPGIPVFSTGVEADRACVEAPRARFLARHLDQAGAAEPFYLKPPHITKPST
jgi:tRNA A37 threonylcarbamoyladenosine modification protein TsaB